MNEEPKETYEQNDQQTKKGQKKKILHTGKNPYENLYEYIQGVQTRSAPKKLLIRPSKMHF